MENLLILYFFTISYYVGAGVSTLMSDSDGLGPYFFRRKMEKTRPLKEVMGGKVFFPPESAFFLYS